MNYHPPHPGHPLPTCSTVSPTTAPYSHLQHPLLTYCTLSPSSATSPQSTPIFSILAHLQKHPPYSNLSHVQPPSPPAYSGLLPPTTLCPHSTPIYSTLPPPAVPSPTYNTLSTTLQHSFPTHILPTHNTLPPTTVLLDPPTYSILFHLQHLSLPIQHLPPTYHTLSPSRTFSPPTCNVGLDL